jgi:hypothetical protein
LEIPGEDIVNGETLPMHIWSAYMAEATTEDPVLDFPLPDRREFVPFSRGYAVNPPDSPRPPRHPSPPPPKSAGCTDTNSRSPPAVI